MATYWQAELLSFGETYDADFPRRATRGEAVADAETALATRFFPEERARLQLTAAASEWGEEPDGGARGTGQCVEISV